MTDLDDMKMILSMFNEINARLHTIENGQFAKLTIARVIDISDDKVHIAKQIVKIWETSEGVVVHVI